MFKNYLKIALRNVKKQKAYAVINIFGLAIGLACSILMLLYVHDELRFDRFHKNADRIVRLGYDGEFGRTARTPHILAPTLLQSSPEVENAVRIKNVERPVVLPGSEKFYEERFYYADPSLFEVFTFPFIAGDPQNALSSPNALVLTEETAQRYLGGWNPLGETLEVVGVALLVGLVAGSYPAFVLSALRPALVLKSASPASSSVPPYAGWIRRGLVVFQFAIFIGLIAGALIVRDQLGFVLNRQLGLDKEQVLAVQRSQALGQQREAFKQKLLQNSGIASAAASNTLPGKLFGGSTYLPLGAPAENSHTMHEMYVDADFMPTLEIALIAGRNFSHDFATDSSAVILNEAAAKQFGWTDPLAGH